MNLIEQLGGYSIAKAEANASVKLLNFIDYDDLDKQLLDYRRTNNIFEVGDFVVEVTEYPESSILQVKHMSDNLMVCENDSLNASYGLLNNTPSFYVRHATQQEIEEGYRL